MPRHKRILGRLKWASPPFPLLPRNHRSQHTVAILPLCKGVLLVRKAADTDRTAGTYQRKTELISSKKGSFSHRYYNTFQHFITKYFTKTVVCGSNIDNKVLCRGYVKLAWYSIRFHLLTHHVTNTCEPSCFIYTSVIPF